METKSLFQAKTSRSVKGTKGYFAFRFLNEYVGNVLGIWARVLVLYLGSSRCLSLKWINYAEGAFFFEPACPEELVWIYFYTKVNRY